MRRVSALLPTCRNSLDGSLAPLGCQWSKRFASLGDIPERQRVLIMGAAGRDFHNFNVYFRDNNRYEVIGFTATQIPGIDDRKYPAELCGKLYPEGIPIVEEDQLERVIDENDIDQVIFSYSDIAHVDVMHKASRAMACQADFRMLGPWKTRLISTKPVISVVASRTGCGKSQTSRSIVKHYREKGLRVVAIRHPMPYGDLVKQKCQRFATYEDLNTHECTIEEREEYEPYVEMGAIIYSGVDYGEILHEAEKEADIILWDGGNNDMSFITPDVQICVVDPHRPGHESLYFPGEVNVRDSHIILVNKVDTASMDNVWQVRGNCTALNSKAILCEAASPIFVDEPELVTGKRVLVVEDGPTLTHGGMKFGAGYVAAKRLQAAEIVDPRPFAVGTIADTFEHYPETTEVLPAMGYGAAQVKDLQDTIDATDADVVVSGTPIDLSRILKVNKPVIRARYELQSLGQPDLHQVINELMEKSAKKKNAKLANE